MYKNDRVTLLLFMSTLGFSQKKMGGNVPTSENEIKLIDSNFMLANIQLKLKTINNRENSSDSIKNTKNNPLIDQINKLELKYLNLKAKEL
tara:strand:+ start:334 stop:606 length:273 start_codon:yes stop_codon:yes gene_type:complete